MSLARSTAIVAFVLALATYALVARADDAPDRKQYISEIERLLSDIASYLKDAESDSSSSRVGYAISKADEVKSKVSSLDRVKGNDSQAKDMVSYYPGYVRSFKEAAGHLRKLKDRQRSLDKLPETCAKARRALDEVIERYIKPNDPKGLEEIPREARKIGEPIKEALKKADAEKSKLERHKDDARRFSETRDKWLYVKSALHDTANRVFAYWKKRHDRVKEQQICGYLADWERNPKVVNALKTLGKNQANRKEIIKQLRSDLRQLNRDVKDFDRDRDASRVGKALGQVNKIDQGLKKLQYAKGAEKTAIEIAKEWPRHVSDVRPALRALKELKKFQFRLDDGPKKCKEAEGKLLNEIKRYENDREGLTRIPALAKKLGEGPRKGLERADRDKSTVSRKRDDVKRFYGNYGFWKNVQNNMGRSADQMYSYWEKALEKAHKACDDLAKGERHPRVVEAIARLTKGKDESEDKFAKLVTDINKHIERSRKARAMDKTALKRVIEYICKLDIEQAGDKASRLAEDMVNRQKTSVISSYDSLRSEREALHRRLEWFLKHKAFKTRAEKQREKLDKDKQAQDNIIKSGSLKNGNNDPILRAKAKYGTIKHREFQSRYSSSRCEKPEFSTGNGRADCVSIKKCEVWELKPSSFTPDKAKEWAEDKYLEAVANKLRKKAAHCWSKTGPTRGEGFVAKGAIYPQCRP